MTETKPEKSDSEKVFTCIGAIAAIPLLLVASSLITGLTLSLLWTWFAVPIFHLRALSVPEAIGVALVVGYLTKQGVYLKSEYMDKTSLWIGTFSSPLLFLAIGWVVHQFVK